MSSYKNNRYEMPLDKEGHLDPFKARVERMRKNKVDAASKNIKRKPQAKKEGYPELYA